MNLAASLAETPNSKVALVDLACPLGNVAGALNLPARFTVADALAAGGRLDSVLLETYMVQHEGIYVLAGAEEFDSVEFTVEGLTELLDIVTHTYTHVVLDFPLSLNREVTGAVLQMSDAIVGVLTPDVLSLRSTERLLRFFENLNVTDKIRFVLNRTTKNDEIAQRDVERTLQHPVRWNVANDYKACMSAIHSGKTLLTFRNRLAEDFREIAPQLLGIQPEKRRRSLLRFLPSPA
jgi:pilus assembly protein CpaE